MRDLHPYWWTPCRDELTEGNLLRYCINELLYKY
jgi:hypothetical protein